MKCRRCKGRMSIEKYYDLMRDFDTWKCFCCGEIADPATMINRMR